MNSQKPSNGKIIIDAEFKALLMPLTKDEYRLLEESIIEEGCRDSLIVWSGKNILLDGHNRHEICSRNDIEFDVIEKEFKSKEEAYDWIINNQLGKRNATPEQQSYLRGKRYNREKSQGKRSDLTICHNDKKSHAHEQLSRDYRVSKETIVRDGKFSEAVDHLTALSDAPEEVKSKILSRDTAISKKSVIELDSMEDKEKAKELLEDIVKDSESGILKTAREIKKEKAKERVAKRERETAEAVEEKHPLNGERYTLIEEDITKLSEVIFNDGEHETLKPESVDAIITDPPYGEDYIPLYNHLAYVAEYLLKPNGHLLVMTGQANLELVFDAMCDYLGPIKHVFDRIDYEQENGIDRYCCCLKYQWTLGYFTPGQSSQQHGRRIKSNWKPVLWFVKGKCDWEHVPDTFVSDENDKRFHEWGQSVGGMAQIIERFTVQKAVVLDPFCGGGSTGVAAVMLDRLFIGMDIEKEYIAQTAERLVEV